MAIYDQPKTTYNDTVPQVRILDQAIRLIDPIDTPLMAALGGLNAASSKFNVRGNGKMVELLVDTYHPTGGTLATDMAAATTTADVTDGSIYQPGHVLKIEDEYMIVLTASATDNTIAVTERAYGGTNATHTSTNGTISIVGMAREEGDDASYVGLQAITSVYNYTQILEKALNVTGTDEAIDYYGMNSPFAYQAKKALPELFRWMELGIFHGIRDVGNGSTQPRSFGGLKTFITSNSTNAGGMITKQDVDTLVYDCFVDGGSPDILAINPHVAGDLKALLDNKDYMRVPIEGNQLGRPPLEYVVTQWGTLRILMDRWCPLADAYALSSKDIGFYQLRPFAWKPLAITGDSKKGEVVGEFSLLVANGAGMGYIYGIT
jgi:hypothetical protein